jgi:hypothetical protein
MLATQIAVQQLQERDQLLSAQNEMLKVLLGSNTSLWSGFYYIRIKKKINLFMIFFLSIVVDGQDQSDEEDCRIGRHG